MFGTPFGATVTYACGPSTYFRRTASSFSSAGSVQYGTM